MSCWDRQLLTAEAGSVWDEAACGVKLGRLLAVGKPARRSSSIST